MKNIPIPQLSNVARKGLTLILVLLTFTGFSQTLTSDHSDYPPGSVVTFTGNGFSAGETVAVRVHHNPTCCDDPTSSAHAPWNITADGSGNFSTTWTVPADEDELGASLIGLADGQSSGLHAEALFTDANTVTVQFRTSAGVGIPDIVPQYLVGSTWTNFTTATDGSGTATQSFTSGATTQFRITYAGVTEVLGSFNTTTNPTISAFTTLVTLNLKDHNGAIITSDGTDTTQYNNGVTYFSFGTLSGGTVSKELLPGVYTFDLTYHSFIQLQSGITISGTGAAGAAQAINFRTSLVTLSLRDHSNGPLSGGLGLYFARNWNNIGNTNSSGDTAVELLPGSYSFRMTYNNFTQTTSATTITSGSPWTQSITPFKTTLVSVNLKDCNSGAIVNTSGAVVTYGSSFFSFGTTSSGSVTKELLAGSYAFRMVYLGATSNQASVPISTGPTQDVDFDATNVTFPTATSASYSSAFAGTYTSFTPTAGVDLLPGSYFFKINGATTGVSKAVSGCAQNFSSAPCSATGIGTTGDCFSKTLTAPAGNTYTWNPGAATTQTITTSTAGNYSVTVTYDFSCSGASNPSIVYSTSVTMPSPFAITASAGSNGSISPSGSTNVCPGNNQSYTITPNAGYHISGVLVDGVSAGTGSTYSFSSVSATHTIIASFAPDCTAPVITSAATATDVTCYGRADGSVTTFVSGSTPLIYSWSNSATTAGLTGVPAATYTYTVTNGCGLASGSATVGSPSQVVATATITQALCNGGAASVLVTATGGSGTSYIGTGAFSLTDGASSTYTVTDAPNGCSAISNSVTATSPSQVVATATITQALCNGGAASVLVTATGGSGTSYIGTGTFSLTDGASSTYTVTDAPNGCSAVSNSVTATSPSQVVATAAITQALCNGGAASVLVTATGGSGTSYTGTGTFSLTDGTSSTYTVTDAPNGCSAISNSVTATSPSQVVATATITQALCNGGAASVLVTATGGSGTSYTGTGTFSLTDGASSTYTVTDAPNGCSAISNSVTATSPSQVVATAAITQALCNGGAASVLVTATGGSGTSYTGTGTFSLTDGTSSAYTVTDAPNGCAAISNSVTATSPSQVVATATITQALCHGGAASVLVTATGGLGTSYTGTGTFSLTDGTSSTYTVTDAPNGCSAVSNSVTATSPSRVVATAAITQALCNGGAASVLVTATGGSGTSYTGTGTFSLTDGTSSTYTVTDVPNGCSAISNSVTATSPSQVVATATITQALCNGGAASVLVTATGGSGTSYSGTGTFSLTDGASSTYTVTDAPNGCSATSNSVTATSPSQVVATATITQALCNGGAASVLVTATGGSGTSYTGTGTFSLTDGTSSTYTVTDAPNGCSGISNSVTATSPSQVVATATITQALCHGGAASVLVTATGGSGTSYTGTGTFPLTDGTSSTYTVTDAPNGCSAVSNSVTATSPSQVVATATITQALCHGGAASVLVTATGGSGTSYSGTGTFSLANGASSTYTVHDAHSCSATSNLVTATSPSQLIASATVTNVSCNSANSGNHSNGAINVTATGGTPPYTNGYGNHTGLTPGTYSYTVTDNHGCTSVTSQTVGQPTAITSTITGSSTALGTVANTFSAPSGYSYHWSVSGTGASIVGGVSGSSASINSICSANSYTVALTTTNTSGCTSSSTKPVSVTQSSTLTVYSSLYETGGGSHPSTTKSILPVSLKVFNRHIVGTRDANQSHYSSVWNSTAGLVSNVSINDVGASSIGGGPAEKYIITVPADGHYLVIGQSVVPSTRCGGTTCTIYTGSKSGGHDDVDGYDHSDEDDDGSCTNSTMRFHAILKDNTGKCSEGSTQQQLGSLMLIISPAALVFTDSVELLPVVYESVDGDWSNSVSADPPYGFYTTDGELSTSVTDSVISTVQFTITDTGSDWTFTKLTHNIQHKGASRTVYTSPKMINARSNKPTELNIAPNPANDAIKIVLPKFEGKATVHIYNMFGQEVAQKKINIIGGTSVSMDITALVNGVYFVTAENSNGKVTSRLVKTGQ